jgi:hypothetical protein
VRDGDERRLAAALRAEQGPGGGFRCSIHHPGGAVETDENGFATALVLRRLAARERSGAMAAVRGAALDFLERCSAPGLPGAFGFWPPEARPAWGRRVGPDVDDTAVISVELWRAGRRTLADLRDTARDVLAAALVTEPSAPHPPWIRPMVFPTWLGPTSRGPGNPIDCAVNANVVALMAACDARDLPGYREASEMIEGAIASACEAPPDRRWLQLRTLTPYYPDPFLFLETIEHAVACRALDLRASGARLARLLRGVPVPAAARGALCSDAYGGPVWRCRALALAGASAPLGRRRGARVGGAEQVAS